VQAAARSAYAVLPGGGVRAINPGPELSLSQTDTCFAILKGCVLLDSRTAGLDGTALHLDWTESCLLRVPRQA
jgi:hypothetical protein